MKKGKCQIDLPQVNILQQLKGYLSEKPFSSLFGGSLDNLISNGIGKEMFGDLDLSGSGLPSIANIKKKLNAQNKKQMAALKKIQDKMQAYKGNKSHISEEALQEFVEAQSERIDNSLEWYVAAGKQISELMTSIKNCSEGIKRSLPSEVQQVISTGDGYIDNVGEVFRDMKTEEIDETPEFLKAVQPTKITPSYKVLEYLIK